MTVQHITYGEALRQAYCEELERDPKVFLMGEDVGRWGSLYRSSRGLLEQFGPRRVRDAPISEAAIAGCAVAPRCWACGRLSRSCILISSHSPWIRS